jgi:integrase
VVEPKSAAGKRTVPIPRALRGHLLEQRLRNGATRYGGSVPAIGRFRCRAPRRHHLGLHECRHAYASYMIAAGVNAKTRTRAATTPWRPCRDACSTSRMTFGGGDW